MVTEAIVRQYVLLIEDDEHIVRVLLRTLHHAGYHAAAASNADDAFTAIAERTPDIVLLDAHLPAVGGLEICRILRAEPATWGTPILFITGDDSAEQRLAAIASGADGFLGKPFVPDVLLDRIRTMLASKHHIDELRTTRS